jgi:hypothetical protein
MATSREYWQATEKVKMTAATQDHQPGETPPATVPYLRASTWKPGSQTSMILPTLSGDLGQNP